MEVATLPKRFRFWEEFRSQITFSDAAKIRLDPESNTVKLKTGAGGFPTDADIYVISPSTNPDAVMKWIGFQADVVHGETPGETIVTSLGFRLHDGTDQYWWNGVSWEVNTTDWNTETEVATNIASYDATATKTLRVVVNLVTTDGSYTPELFGIRLAYEANLPSVKDDIIYRTLLRKLKTLRPTFDFIVTAGSGTTVALGTALTNAKVPFDDKDVDSVFNYTDDSDLTTDLLSSYNTTTKVITLTGAQDSGDKLLVRVLYEPVVVFAATHPDYTEIEKIPSLVVTDFVSIDSHPLAQKDAVVDKSAGTLIEFQPPYRTNYRCSIIATAPGGVDLQRLTDALQDFVEQNTILRATGTDEPFRIRLTNEFTSTTSPTEEGIHAGQATMEMREVIVYRRKERTSAADGVYPVLTVELAATQSA